MASNLTNAWTPEQDAILIADFHAGLSGGESAKKFGVSRNAVIGRRWRLGLKTGVAAKPAARSAWSEERAQIALQHYKEGISAKESAAILGDTTQAAVEYLRSYRGWTKQFGSSFDRSTAKRGALTSNGTVTRERATSSSRFDRAALHVCGDTTPKRIIDGIGAYECRWPLEAVQTISTVETRFCCKPIKPGISYCTAHAALAFAPKPPKTSDLIRGLRRYA